MQPAARESTPPAAPPEQAPRGDAVERQKAHRACGDHTWQARHLLGGVRKEIDALLLVAVSPAEQGHAEGKDIGGIRTAGFRLFHPREREIPQGLFSAGPPSTLA